jgi:hypothetical protein
MTSHVSGVRMVTADLVSGDSVSSRQHRWQATIKTPLGLRCAYCQASAVISCDKQMYSTILSFPSMFSYQPVISCLLLDASLSIVI